MSTTTILEQYIANHPGSAERYREAVSIFPGGVTHDNRYAEPFPLYITHGQGPRKWDVDGHAGHTGKPVPHPGG